MRINKGLLCKRKAESDAVVRAGEESEEIGPDTWNVFHGFRKVIPPFRPAILVEIPDEKEGIEQRTRIPQHPLPREPCPCSQPRVGDISVVPF
jgi:hypothetical protein